MLQNIYNILFSTQLSFNQLELAVCNYVPFFAVQLNLELTTFQLFERDKE